MKSDVIDAFQGTARLSRLTVFATDALMPIRAIADAETAAPGWVGPEWHPGGTLLMGINPGGGGDGYRVNPTDERLYGLIRAFRDADESNRCGAFAAMSEAWMGIQATHNIRRVIDAVLEATRSSASQSAFMNVVPFRTRNDAAPRKADVIRAWQAGTKAQVAALRPRRVIALGRKAYDALLNAGAGDDREIILIKRSIGDSTVTQDARDALDQLRRASGDPAAAASVSLSQPEHRSVATGTTIRQAPATAATRYKTARRPGELEGYAQRIPMWEAVKRLGSVDRAELLTELRRIGYVRPNGAHVDEAYCRTELTDMTKRGHLRRLT